MRSLVSGRSFEALTHANSEFTAGLVELLRRDHFDVVNFEFSHMAPYRSEIHALAGNARFVLDEHNIEYDVLKQTAARESGRARGVYNAVNWRKLKCEEFHAWSTFHGCSVTSEGDRDLLLRDLPGAKVAVVPNAVDLEHFRRPSDAASPEPLSILFFGAINYFPNSDGLRFFLDQIAPHIWARLPGARLRVVGHTPEQLLSLTSEHVEMRGLVPDIRDEISRAAVVIAPLRLGGGTRLKILEAMAMATPVVSTPQGAEGLDVTHGKELLLADSPTDFADEVVRVLQDAPLARRLGEAGRKLVEGSYGWSASIERLEGLYCELGAGTN